MKDVRPKGLTHALDESCSLFLEEPTCPYGKNEKVVLKFHFLSLQAARAARWLLDSRAIRSSQTCASS